LFKNGEFSKVIKACNVVLKNDENHMKALYRRALAYIGISDKSSTINMLSVKKQQQELLGKARHDL